MVVKIGKSRRLFLLLVTCLIANHSTPSELVPLIGTSQNSHADPFDSHVMWIVDEASGLCLSHLGFSTCGDVNLFKWHSYGRTNTLVKFENVLPPVYNSTILLEQGGRYKICNKEEKDSLCLSRMMFMRNTHPETTLSKCSSPLASATTWEYDHDNMMLSTATGFMSNLLGSLCIVRDGSRVGLQNCNMGFTKLKVVVHTKRNEDSKVARSNMELESENEEWVDPKTGLVFPRNLDDRIPSLSTSTVNGIRADRQVLMGADIFAKTAFNINFKVYTVAWYVDYHGASKDPNLHAFEGLSSNELATSDKFYQAMTKGLYDRTIFVKLAMNLKTELMIRGLVQELQITPKNAKLLSEAARNYEYEDCPKGMEIMFTWRHPQESNFNKDLLEIRLNSILYATLDEPGLALDFFEQFVHQEEPVSVGAKMAFVEGFPTLLSSGTNSPKTSEGIINSKQQKHQKQQQTVVDKITNSLKGEPSVVRYKKTSKKGKFAMRFREIESNNNIDVDPHDLSWKEAYIPSVYAAYVWWKGTKGGNSRARIKTQSDSLLITERDTKLLEELIATVLIVLYLTLLLILSLPPAMIKRGRRVVMIVKKKLWVPLERKIEKIHVALKRTVSCTSLCTSSLPYKQSVTVINAMT
jgi:hypothetical protein